MSYQQLRVTLPKDENGMTGRQCKATGCGQYFKVKLGTGLKTATMHCPYCGASGSSSDFHTPDQIEYAKSVAIKQLLDPMMRDFKQSVERLNQPARNSLISLRFEVQTPSFRVHNYREKDVETAVVCDSCGLEFAVFGVFASCPDCTQINAFNVFNSSLEVCRKLMALTERDDSTGELGRELRQDLMGRAVGAFDALGKKLRELRSDVFPSNPRNLFQNYDALDKALTSNTGKGIADRIGGPDAADLLRLFQVRHLFEHTLGVVDEDFIKKVATASHLKGHKYTIKHEDVERLISLLEKLAKSIRADVFNQSGGKPA